MTVFGAITDTIGKDIAFENFSPFTDCLIETRRSFVVQVFTNYNVDYNCPTHFSLIFKFRKTKLRMLGLLFGFQNVQY